MSTSLDPRERDTRLHDARQRLLRLEAETHRLRAELARLEAAGEDAAAEQIEARLRRSECDLSREQRRVDPAPIEAGAAKHGLSASATAPGEPVTIEPTGKLIKSAAKRRTRRRTPAWAVSLAAHLLLVLSFGATGFATLTETPSLLLASATDAGDDLLDELVEINFDEPLKELEVEEAVTEFDALELTELELDESDTPWADAPSEAVTPAAFDALPLDVGSLMTSVDQAGGDGGAGQGGDGEKAGGGPPRGGAKFFGARSDGGRFAFVVDNSGSMKEGRLETTLMEIQRSVNQMSAEQMFYVIFYSDQAYPMFFPSETNRLEPATRANKQKLSNWLGTIEMCVGGQLRDAMKLAEKIEPDTVFLLSDGEIGAGTMRFMTEDRGWPFVVNTLGMTVPDQQAADNLIAIAGAHNGLFFPVGVYPAAARMAKQRPIPYRNSRSGPGPVWGSKVRRSR